MCGVPSAPACTNSICPELLNKLESWIKWNPISRFFPKCTVIIEIQISELNELDVCLQSSATQTACRARERLITVTAAGTHRPYFISAAACPSVQWASTPKDEYVQVGLAFKSTVHQRAWTSSLKADVWAVCWNPESDISLSTGW